MEPNIQATRQLHKRIGQLFENTLTNSMPTADSQYQNLSDLSQTPTLSHHNACFFLPPNHISKEDPTKKIEIKRVEMTTDYHENQMHLTYQIQWLERNKKPEELKKKKKEKSGSAKGSKANSEESEADEPVPLVKKTSSMMKISGKGRCDGPCGQIVDFSTAVQFGCDHVICESCRKKCPSTALFDGSPGCCNASCVEVAKSNGEKLCSGQSDSAPSVISRTGTSEVVPTRVCILKNYGKDVLRTQLEFEFPSSARLSVILKSLTHYKDLINKSRFFYSTQRPKRRSDLIPICLTETNQRFNDIINMNSPMLFVIVIGQGIQFYDSR